MYTNKFDTYDDCWEKPIKYKKVSYRFMLTVPVM